eukprot:1963488-Rhodomonas_salina.1
MSQKKVAVASFTEAKQELEQQVLDDHEKAFDRSQTLISQLMQAISKDILSVDTATIGLSSAGFSNRTSLGMVLAGCVIDDLVVGGPAALSQKIQKGDKILKVDEVPVSLDTVRFFSRDSSFAMGR